MKYSITAVHEVDLEIEADNPVTAMNLAREKLTRWMGNPDDYEMHVNDIRED